jgi:hypothetical protein
MFEVRSTGLNAATRARMALRELLRSVQQFARDDRGLVTVEWVALAAAVVVGGITLVWLVINHVKTNDGALIGTGINTTANSTTSQHSP